MRIAIIAAAISMASVAHAADLTVDLKSPILDAEGNQQHFCKSPFGRVMPDPDCKDDRPETFKFVAMTALDSDGQLKGEDRGLAGALAIKIGMTDTITLTLDEAKLIKRAVTDIFNPVVVARITSMLGEPIK